MIRRDLALALSTGWPPESIALLDDREKITVWTLLEEARDRRGDDGP